MGIDNIPLLLLFLLGSKLMTHTRAERMVSFD
jgi:hypothetical protein